MLDNMLSNWELIPAMNQYQSPGLQAIRCRLYSIPRILKIGFEK